MTEAEVEIEDLKQSCIISHERVTALICTEDDLLPVSLLQHLIFCTRRAALVQIEGAWEENIFTVEGSILHNKVDDDLPVESRRDVRITRGLLLRSLRLGLSGKADVVEFHRVHEEEVFSPNTKCLPAGIPLEDAYGLWRPFPVDYKRGRLRHEEGFEVQLCAQALCLEEMLGVFVPVGAIFYGKPRRRLEVAFDVNIRNRTEQAASKLHDLFQSGLTPPARYEKKCESCSLMDLCMPKVTGKAKSVARYLSRMIEQ
jgi:CRISPR-associated exonuclease Cas4